VVRPELMARREPEKVEAAAAPAGSEPARQLELTGREAAILASALKSFADVYPAGDPIRDEVRVLLAKLKSGPATRRSG